MNLATWPVWPHILITVGIAVLAAASGFRPEYLAVAAMWAVLTAWGPRSRRFLGLALPFLAVGIIYDKVLPLLAPLRATVRVAELYHAEQAIFGFHTALGLEIPCEWLGRHTSAILDVPCGFAYIAYLYEVFVVAIWLYFVDEKRTARLSWAFLLCNVIGMTCELAFPAAPPWYIHAYGLGPAHLEVMASPAGAARFDTIFGIHYFASFYGRSHDVFGAMPSLHVAYPVLAVFAVWNAGRRWAQVAAVTFAALVAFAAVYLDHHYVLDVIGGALVGALAYGLVIGTMRLWRGAPERQLSEPRPDSP